MTRPEPQSRRLTPLNQPRPISVRADGAGQPVAVRRDRDWTSVEVLEAWRIDDGWWREGTEVERHYYQLALPHGAVLTVFRDGVRSGWFEQRAGASDPWGVLG